MMTYRSSAHLAFIRLLPCVLCLNPISTEAAHLRMSDGRVGKKNSGIGQKPPDYFTLPLCSACHRAQHTMGNEGVFWNEHGIDPVLISLALFACGVSGDNEQAEYIIRSLHA